jgi:hypothetical protein
MLESDADRLDEIRTFGEQFDTGKPTRMWAIFDRAYEETLLNDHSFGARRPMLHCQTSDVTVHELVKTSKVTRVSDGKQYFIEALEDDGTGVTVVVLRA